MFSWWCTDYMGARHDLLMTACLRLLAIALISSCGSSHVDNPPTPPAAGSGDETMDAGSEAGAYSRVMDSGIDAGVPQQSVAGEAAEAGNGGVSVPSGGAGATAQAGGSSGQPAAVGGVGSGEAGHTGSAGQPAPAESVLWSQSWTVAIHEASGGKACANATMGLMVDGGSLCRLGNMGVPSGTSQTIATDITCLKDALTAVYGVAVVYDSTGKQICGSAGRAELAGWKEAVEGHKVTALRRSQTYTVKVVGSGSSAYNYADFAGTLEIVGF